MVTGPILPYLLLPSLPPRPLKAHRPRDLARHGALLAADGREVSKIRLDVRGEIRLRRSRSVGNNLARGPPVREVNVDGQRLGDGVRAGSSVDSVELIIGGEGAHRLGLAGLEPNKLPMRIDRLRRDRAPRGLRRPAVPVAVDEDRIADLGRRGEVVERELPLLDDDDVVVVGVRVAIDAGETFQVVEVEGGLVGLEDEVDLALVVLGVHVVGVDFFGGVPELGDGEGAHSTRKADECMAGGGAMDERSGCYLAGSVDDEAYRRRLRAAFMGHTKTSSALRVCFISIFQQIVPSRFPPRRACLASLNLQLTDRRSGGPATSTSAGSDPWRPVRKRLRELLLSPLSNLYRGREEGKIVVLRLASRDQACPWPKQARIMHESQSPFAPRPSRFPFSSGQQMSKTEADQQSSPTAQPHLVPFPLPGTGGI
ncbi:hypothetical protein BDK51DRAFT_52980 [Blyttiomyces helicus]|uniref:Uncharacterized protein n=1 Tax=Blyttiomyces helicus TaxID=388810 RepID=A0A4P9VZT2_9FUNG|nr:hypothetical protein BDK51DRAFT_52980 [Blyttiomyces helicus]|eukprot:RKO84313.1 hypothetical protein BDK51DRAFT_52980 [Blyttiomyces helicus]